MTSNYDGSKVSNFSRSRTSILIRKGIGKELVSYQFLLEVGLLVTIGKEEVS